MDKFCYWLDTYSEVFDNTINEINRVLKKNGTFFLVEKTSHDLSNKQIIT